MNPAVIVRSRAGGRYAVAVVVACLLGAVCAPYSLKIEMAADHPAVLIGLAELAALTLTCTGLIVLRPRLWTIDRLGTPGRRWIPAAGAAALTLAGPQLVLGIAPVSSWPASATTVLVLTGIGLILLPWAGALRATGTVISLYLGLTLAAHLSRVVQTWSPVVVVTWPAATPVPAAKVALALATAAVALAIHVRTLGSTMRTWRGDLNSP